MRFTWKKALAVGVLGCCAVSWRMHRSLRKCDVRGGARSRRLGPAAKPAAATPTADQVLDHYVQAIGGRAAWMKLNSRVSKGTH